jgi:RimJ/RimL family protein N-acetyltransferase
LHRARGNRVLVFFGASDSTDETSKVIEALCAPELAEWAADIVIGSNHPNPERIRRFAAGRTRTSLHENLQSLAPLLSRADLAIGGGGTTTWERLCLGVPSVVATLADNQVTVTEPLARAGYVRWIGSSSETTSASYLEAVRSRPVLGDLVPLVDGYGTTRVAEYLLPSDRERLQLRRAQPQDAEELFIWRNDTDARAMSLDQSEISWPTHFAWFMRKLSDADTLVYVLEVDHLPVGQIRFDFESQEAALSYGLDRLVRGRGWSSSLITAGMAEVARLRPVSVRAVVKAENEASRKVFTRLGWSESSANDHIVFRSP